MTTNQITVDGRVHTVLNCWSTGPGRTPHTYRIAGAYVYQCGGWTIQRDGQVPVPCAVVL